MFKEFKEFAFKGNIIDMAVGVIIGGAFGKIVTSVVNDLVMPAIGYVLAGISFTDLKCVLAPEVLDAEGNVVTPETAILYGNFIQNCVDFLIVAFCVFLFVQAIAKSKAKLEAMKAVEEEAPAEEEEPAPTTEELLAEIRDLLKKEN